MNSRRKFGAESDQIAHVVRVGAEDVICLLFCEFEKLVVIDGSSGAVEAVVGVGTVEVVGVDGEEKRRRGDVLHVVPLPDE